MIDLDLPTLWSLSGSSYVQMESQTGLDEQDLKRLLREHGFERCYASSQQFVRGPCVSCGVPYPTEELDATHRCQVCSEDTEPARDPELERERQASRARIRQRREQGLPVPERIYT